MQRGWELAHPESVVIFIPIRKNSSVQRSLLVRIQQRQSLVLSAPAPLSPMTALLTSETLEMVDVSASPHYHFESRNFLLTGRTSSGWPIQPVDTITHNALVCVSRRNNTGKRRLQQIAARHVFGPFKHERRHCMTAHDWSIRRQTNHTIGYNTRSIFVYYLNNEPSCLNGLDGKSLGLLGHVPF